MERKLTAIFSADVQGYSRLMGEDEEATIRTLTAYRELMTSGIQRHRGRVVDSPGDNLLAEFASAVDAVQAAVAIQKELKMRNEELPPHRRMAYRIGINVGDIVAEGERIYGDGVNIAARVESLADGGGICISGTAYDQIENKLAFKYEYIGEQTVKNIAKPVRAYKVQLEPGTATTPTVRAVPPAPRPIEKKVAQRRWPRAALAVVAVLVVGAGVALLRNIYQPPSSPPSAGSSKEAPALPLPDTPSVAVLPFTNMSDDPEQEYFSDGMTDDLITDLSRLSGLLVIARHSVFSYKGKTVNMKEVSRELGVRYVLEGSVRRAGDQVRINAQLIDATSGYHLWAERYDRDLKDIFTLQDEIMQKIVRALEIKLTKGEQERFRLAPTENLEAYDYFLRGWGHYWHQTQKEMAQARQMFEKAVQLDSECAGAHAGLSNAYLSEFVLQWDPNPQTLERAFELAQKAVALDDSSALAHHALGVVYPWKKQMDQAISELERAITLDPNYATAYAMLADTLNWVGRPEEAIGLMKKAMRLNPHYDQYQAWYTYALGNSYRLAGQNEEAIATLKRSLTHNPSWWPSYIFLAVIYSEQGKEEEARAAAAEVLRINPNFSLELGRQSWPYKDPAQLERDMAALRKAGLK